MALSRAEMLLRHSALNAKDPAMGQRDLDLANQLAQRVQREGDLPAVPEQILLDRNPTPSEQAKTHMQALSPSELVILELMQASGEALSPAELRKAFRAATGKDISTITVQVYISKIRQQVTGSYTIENIGGKGDPRYSVRPVIQVDRNNQQGNVAESVTTDAPVADEPGSEIYTEANDNDLTPEGGFVQQPQINGQNTEQQVLPTTKRASQAEAKTVFDVVRKKPTHFEKSTGEMGIYCGSRTIDGTEYVILEIPNARGGPSVFRNIPQKSFGNRFESI